MAARNSLKRSVTVMGNSDKMEEFEQMFQGELEEIVMNQDCQVGIKKLIETLKIQHV